MRGSTSEGFPHFFDVPTLELFNGPMAIVGEPIKVARVVALRLWGELLELLGSLVVGDHGGDAAIRRAPHRGARTSKQGGVTRNKTPRTAKYFAQVCSVLFAHAIDIVRIAEKADIVAATTRAARWDSRGVSARTSAEHAKGGARKQV